MCIFCFNECEIRECRYQGKPAAAVAEYGCNLRNNAGCQHLASHDTSERIQRVGGFFEAHAATVDDADDRCARLPCQTIEPCDLLCMHFADRATEHRDILAENVYEVAVDRTEPGYNPVRRCLSGREIKIGTSRSDLRTDFDKTVRVKQRFNSPACSILCQTHLMSSIRFINILNQFSV